MTRMIICARDAVVRGLCIHVRRLRRWGVRHEIELCDWCQKALVRGESKSGVSVKLVESKGCGGWGHASTLTDKSMEVCDECYAEFIKMAGQIMAFVKGREGINTPTIYVQNPKPRQSDTVFEVRTDEPPPQGRFRKILRILP